MSKLPGVNHLDAVCALEKADFRIVRQGKHIVMSNGERLLTIPRHNPVKVFALLTKLTNSPIFSIENHGSVGASTPPFYKSSIEILSGEHTIYACFFEEYFRQI